MCMETIGKWQKVKNDFEIKRSFFAVENNGVASKEKMREYCMDEMTDEQFESMMTNSNDCFFDIKENNVKLKQGQMI